MFVFIIKIIIITIKKGPSILFPCCYIKMIKYTYNNQSIIKMITQRPSSKLLIKDNFSLTYKKNAANESCSIKQI
ncbi:hypothetical protein pb186bvf_010541 [Paramecium bursaria]